MTAKFFAILTNQGAAKLANATALGTKLDLTHLAVGDGGGTLPTPDPAQTQLKGEKRRAAINMLSVDPDNLNQVIAEQVIPENEGGWWIREIGLFDKDGIMIAVANCPETYKPQLQEGSGRTQTIRMVLIVSSTEAVTLKIDPSVVLATRDYVDSAITAHAKSRNHPDASTTAKGFVQLSNATDNTSETQAATPKAIKAINDATVKLVQNLADLPDKSVARNNLGLKAASLRDVGTNSGNVMEVGAFGVGSTSVAKLTDCLASVPSGHYYGFGAGAQSPTLNCPPESSNSTLTFFVTSGNTVTHYICLENTSNGVNAWFGERYSGMIKWTRAYTSLYKPTAADTGALERTDFPVGIPQPWSTSSAPVGWLKCNGAAFDKAKYPLLATAYPTGTLPDLRGEFLRAWDDGRGVDSGRGLLTAQAATWIQPNIENNAVQTGIVLGNGESEFNSGVIGGVANMSGNASNGPRNRWYIRPRNIAFNYIVRAA